MLILGIDTATSETEIALVDSVSQKVIFAKSWKSDHDEAERLLPQISVAIEKADGRKIDAIYVIEGPGSFTGLRIGVTASNILGLVSGAKLYGIDTFEFMAVKAKSSDKDFAVVLRAGGDNLAVRRSEKEDYEIVKGESLGEFLRGNYNRIKLAVTDIPAKERSKYILPAGCGWMADRQMASFGEALLRLSLKKKVSRKIISPYYLQPPKITQSSKPKFV